MSKNISLENALYNYILEIKDLINEDQEGGANPLVDAAAAGVAGVVGNAAVGAMQGIGYAAQGVGNAAAYAGKGIEETFHCVPPQVPEQCKGGHADDKGRYHEPFKPRLSTQGQPVQPNGLPETACTYSARVVSVPGYPPGSTCDSIEVSRCDRRLQATGTRARMIACSNPLTSWAAKLGGDESDTVEFPEYVELESEEQVGGFNKLANSVDCSSHKADGNGHMTFCGCFADGDRILTANNIERYFCECKKANPISYQLTSGKTLDELRSCSHPDKFKLGGDENDTVEFPEYVELESEEQVGGNDTVEFPEYVELE